MSIKPLLILIILTCFGCDNTHGELGDETVASDKLDVFSSKAESSVAEIGFSFLVDEAKLALGEVVITTTLVNQSQQEIRFLKWQTPFEERILGPVYKVYFAGAAVRYTGMMVKRGNPDASQFITVAAGQQYQHSQILSVAYDMCAAGRYQIAYDSVITVSIAPESASESKLVRVTTPEELSIEIPKNCDD